MRLRPEGEYTRARNMGSGVWAYVTEAQARRFNVAVVSALVFGMLGGIAMLFLLPEFRPRFFAFVVGYGGFGIVGWLAGLVAATLLLRDSRRDPSDAATGDRLEKR